MKHLFIIVGLLSITTPTFASGIYKRDTQGWKDKHPPRAEEAEEREPGLILCPDNTYVRGKACILCVDGSYKGNQCTLGPDGRYY